MDVGMEEERGGGQAAESSRKSNVLKDRSEQVLKCVGCVSR